LNLKFFSSLIILIFVFQAKAYGQDQIHLLSGKVILAKETYIILDTVLYRRVDIPDSLFGISRTSVQKIIFSSGHELSLLNVLKPIEIKGITGTSFFYEGRRITVKTMGK